MGISALRPSLMERFTRTANKASQLKRLAMVAAGSFILTGITAPASVPQPRTETLPIEHATSREEPAPVKDSSDVKTVSEQENHARPIEPTRVVPVVQEPEPESEPEPVQESITQVTEEEQTSPEEESEPQIQPEPEPELIAQPEPKPTPTPAPVPVAPAPSAVCSCSGNVYNCDDFSGHASAQRCYDYCYTQTGRDVHALDRDKDGLACE